MHANNIVHGDLRAVSPVTIPAIRTILMFSQGNILVNDHYVPMLTDFGLSILRGIGSTSADIHSSCAGTIRFMAPELFNDENAKVSFSSDIYAFGCVCIEVCLQSHDRPVVGF